MDCRVHVQLLGPGAWGRVFKPTEEPHPSHSSTRLCLPSPHLGFFVFKHREYDAYVFPWREGARWWGGVASSPEVDPRVQDPWRLPPPGGACCAQQTPDPQAPGP